MKNWLQEKKIDIKQKVILFLVSPFLSFVYSLTRIKTKSSYVVFYMFFIFFGLAFTVESGRPNDEGLDGSSYRYDFEQSKNMSSHTYLTGLYEYLTFKEGAKDYYFVTSTFLLSRITNNYHILFMVFAIIFGYFSLKSLKILTSEPNFTTSLSCFILVYLFMSNQIFNINGVRFWTAAWIGVYAIFQIFRNGNNKYFLLAAITPFFHAAFWIYLVIVGGAFFYKRHYKIWVVLFVASFFVSNISVDFVTRYIDLLPTFIARSAQTYTSAEHIEEVNKVGSGFYWVAQIFKYSVRIYLNLLVWLFIRNSKTIFKNPKSNALFPFLLVWMSFVNFTMPIPSVGNRFVMLAYPMIAYIWLVNFKGVKYEKVLYAMPFVFLFSFYNQLKLYLMVIDFSFLYSSPFYLVYKYL